MCYRTRKYTVCRRVRTCIIQPGNFTGWGIEGVKRWWLPSAVFTFTDLVVHEDSRKFLSVSDYISPRDVILEMVWLLLHLQVDFDTINYFIIMSDLMIVPVHISTRAGFCLLPWRLDQHVAPFVCWGIAWRCVRSVCTDWPVGNVSHILATG